MENAELDKNDFVNIRREKPAGDDLEAAGEGNPFRSGAPLRDEPRQTVDDTWEAMSTVEGPWVCCTLMALALLSIAAVCCLITNTVFRWSATSLLVLIDVPAFARLLLHYRQGRLRTNWDQAICCWRSLLLSVVGLAATAPFGGLLFGAGQVSESLLAQPGFRWVAALGFLSIYVMMLTVVFRSHATPRDNN